MDRTQKQIILNEIDVWRRNRLLPAEYCDFLSNLYREGEPSQQGGDGSRHPSGWHRPTLPWSRLFGWLAAAGLSLLFVLHFTSFPNWMQIGILICVSQVNVGIDLLQREMFLGLLLLESASVVCPSPIQAALGCFTRVAPSTPPLSGCFDKVPVTTGSSRLYTLSPAL